MPIMFDASWLLAHIYECTVYIYSTTQGPPISITCCKSRTADHAPGKGLRPISTCAPHSLVISTRHTGGAVCTDGHTQYRICKDQKRLKAKAQVVPHAPFKAASQHWNQAGSLTMLDTLFSQQAIKRVTSRQWMLLLVVHSLHTHGYALSGCFCTRPWPGPRPCKFHANNHQGRATDVLQSKTITWALRDATCLAKNGRDGCRKLATLRALTQAEYCFRIDPSYSGNRIQG